MAEAAGLGLRVFIALGPAAVRLWTGRSLMRSLDDAAIGERILATQKVNTFGLAFATALLIFLAPGSAAWLLPLTCVAYIAAAYPLRRALYEETWSFAGYLWFTLRLVVAAAGYWVLLALAPVIASGAGSRDWMVSLVAGGVLWIWNARSVDVFRALVRTQPLRDPELLARFERLAAVTGIPMPRFEQVEMKGGVLANAVALASLRRSAVAFTDTLLARLSADESAAICAHELAHLEHFNPQRLRRLSRGSYALITAGALLPVSMRAWGLPALPVWIAWTGTILGALIWIARDRQRNETASDLRAVAISGDGEALVRALTKGYAIARMPRRLHPDFEKHATHPSLARRIRDIREAAGTPHAALDTAVTFVGLDGRTSVSFQPDRLHWIEGEVATHSLSYAHLAELRVDAARTGRSTLVAVETGGRRWEVPIGDADVSRVQSALDLVDARLAKSRAMRDPWPRIARVLSAVLALLALFVVQFATALVALIALLRPSSAPLGAAGAAGLVGALLSLRDQGFDGDATRIAAGILCGTCAAGAFIAAVARRGRDESRGGGRLAAALAVAAVPALAVLLLEGEGVVRLHMWARSMAAAAVLPLACAAALAFSGGRAARWLSAAAAAVGAAVIGAGSPVVLDALADDPLLPRALPPLTKTLDGKPAREFSVPFPVATARLSPSGERVASVRVADYDTDETATAFHVGRAGGPLTPVSAQDLVFLGDEHLLTVENRANGVDLRQLDIDAPHGVRWQRHIPGIVSTELSVDRSTNRWRVVGFESGEVTLVEGEIGGVGEQRWTVARGRPGLFAVAAAGRSAVAVESTYEPNALQARGFWQLALFLPLADMSSHIWHIDASGRRDLGLSRAEVRCVSEQVGLPRLACVAFDGTRSRVVTLDPGTGRVTPVAVLKGRFFFDSRVMNGWLTGWNESGPVALQLDRAEIVRVGVDPGGPVPSSLAAADDMVAAVTYGDPGSVVRLYAIEE
jgi:Zn-dependent protease with chaperone function